MPTERLPAPVMAFAIEPKTKGDEDKVFTSLRRLQEEDRRSICTRRADRRADRRRALTDHVEVIVDRLRSRFGAESR